MHREIELVSGLAGSIFSDFIDAVTFINPQFDGEKINHPAITFFPERGSWMIRLYWQDDQELRYYQQAYPPDVLGSAVSTEGLKEEFLRIALAAYPKPAFSNTYAG
jgi:hypothetical protein